MIGKPLRRKAGSGTRPTTQRTDTASSSKGNLMNPLQQKIGAGSFLAAKQTVNQGIQHIRQQSNKAINEITGIVLKNKNKDINTQGSGGGIRQIKHLNMNVGSNERVIKPATRVGDISTKNKKEQNGARGNPEKFVGSIFRPAPKIGGVGIPAVSKEGSQGRRPAMHNAGSASHVVQSQVNSASGSQAFI